MVCVMHSTKISPKSNIFSFLFHWKCSFKEVHLAENPTWIDQWFQSYEQWKDSQNNWKENFPFSGYILQSMLPIFWLISLDHNTYCKPLTALGFEHVQRFQIMLEIQNELNTSMSFLVPRYHNWSVLILFLFVCFLSSPLLY